MPAGRCNRPLVPSPISRYADRFSRRADNQPGRKDAIVTGASFGIGAATARALRDAGVKVAVGARRVDRLEGDFTHELDVTDPGSAERFVEAAVEALGGLDILVNTPAARSAGTRSGSRARTTRSG